MNESDVLAYVKASAALQGLPLDEARAHAVAVHLARTAHLAQLLDDAPMAPEDELAEIYKPMPFKSSSTINS
jgi:putative heme iron utilization protein